MKKLLTFLTLLTLFFATGWAETKTITWQGGTGGDSSTELTASNIFDDCTTESDYSFLTCNAISKVYKAGNSNGLKFGSGKAVGYMQFGATGNLKPTKIVVSAKKYGSDTGNIKITVNGNNDYSASAQPSSADTFSDIELNLDGTITLTSLRISTTDKRAYVKSIVITYEEGGSTVETVATPTFSPAQGTYYEAQNVTISCATDGATIHYTTDGSDPDENSPEYNNSPISVSETTTIKAIAVKDGMNNSAVATATYTIFTPKTVTPTYEEPFSTEFGKFYTKNVSGINVWSLDASYHYAKASGYSSGATAAEGWLISPYINLTNASNPELSFSHAGNHFTDVATMQSDVQVMVRQLNGTNWSDWSVLTINTWPTGADWNFVDNTTSLSTYAGETIQIAFKYTSSTSRAGSWEIKNFKIENVATKYSVTCNTADNGSITTDEDEYAEGETVNVTVTPDPGYELATLVYNDGVDHDIKDAKSFNMPASNVTVTATFSKVGDLYVMGNVNGIDVNVWHANQGVKMDFINGAYTADIWVTGKWNDEMQKNAGSFAFTKVLANNGSGDGAWGWVNGYGHRIQPSANGKYYWLNSGSVSNIPLYVRGDNDGEKEFLIPAGLYTITVTPADPSVQNDTWKFSLVEKNLTPTITPDGGDVALNSTATVALQENYNDFIANCPKVTECTPVNGSDVYTELSLTLPEVKLVLNGNVAEGTTTDYEFATAGSVTLTGEGKLMLSGSEITSATKTATFNVTAPNTSNQYRLITSVSDLEAGKKYIIVSETKNKAAGEFSSKYLLDTDIEIANNIATATDDVMIFTLGGDVDNGWTFTSSEGLMGANSSKDINFNNNKATNVATISFGTQTLADESVHNEALITFGTNGHIIHNVTSTRFKTYTSDYNAGMLPVQLYKQVEGTVTPTTATPVIAPDSQDVKGGLLEDVTITAAEGATIYYTTDGSDPSDETNENRKQYTEPFNIQVTQGGPQTVKAIAIENGKDPSNVVSVQYMFKNPDAPTFTPDPDVVQTGDFTITINSADGGVIYYVLDPDANEFPSNSEEAIATGLVYENGVNVTGYGEHKIYAAILLNGLRSTLSTATYTVIETGAEGDWKLVENLDDIKAGRDYIIVNSDRDKTVGEFNPTLTSGNFSSIDCENNVVFGPNFNTATVAGSNVTIFTVEEENGNLYMKSGDTYYVPSTTESYINTGKNPVYFSMNGGFVAIKGSADADRSFAYNYQSSMRYFASYKNPTTTGNQRPVYMYYRGADVTPRLTLAELCATGEEDHEYVIADMLKVAYVDPDRGLAWCKDLGDKSIVKTSIHEGEQIDFMNDAQITGETGQNGRDWDQSNWILLQFTAPTGSNGIDEMLKNADRKLVKPGTIKGKLVYNDNYILKMSEDHLELLTKSDAGYDETPYVANVYCPSNFLPENLNIWGSIEAGDGAYSANNTQNYFFMNPKIQEVCYITYAQWNALGYFTVPSNSGIKGGFQVGWAYNNYYGTPSLQDGKIYKFHAIVNRTDKEYGPNNPISAKDEIPFSEHITVLPIDLTGDDNIITAINTVNVNGEVKSVKYVNVAGVMSDVPFEGVNIVVTEYTDGSRSTSKMLKR